MATLAFMDMAPASRLKG